MSNRVGNPEYRIFAMRLMYGCVFRREALFCWMCLFLIRQKVVTVQKTMSWGNKFSAKTCIRWYPTRSDTNRAVEPQKIARGWHFWFRKLRKYSIYVTKKRRWSAARLQRADLRLCFRICKMLGFLMTRLVSLIRAHFNVSKEIACAPCTLRTPRIRLVFKLYKKHTK